MRCHISTAGLPSKHREIAVEYDAGTIDCFLLRLGILRFPIMRMRLPVIGLLGALEATRRTSQHIGLTTRHSECQWHEMSLECFNGGLKQPRSSRYVEQQWASLTLKYGQLCLLAPLMAAQVHV
jgi:hypothetical protein